METNDTKDLLSKYEPEKLYAAVTYFNIGMACGRLLQYLDDNPDQKEKILKILKDDGAS